jgi:hypothetical protein
MSLTKTFDASSISKIILLISKGQFLRPPDVYGWVWLSLLHPAPSMLHGVAARARRRCGRRTCTGGCGGRCRSRQG